MTVSTIDPIEGKDHKYRTGLCPYCGELVGLDMKSLKAHAKVHGLPDEAWLA